MKAASTMPSLDQRQALLDAGTALTRAGLTRGSSGNISLRIDDQLVMSPTGTDLNNLDREALSVLTLDGDLIAGDPPSKEFPFHRALYRRDDTTNAVVHVHAPATIAVSCLEPWKAWSAVPPLTPYFVMRVGQTPLIPYADPGSQEQADLIEAIPYPVRAVLLQNHGSITTGATIAEAVDAAIELEQACDTLLRTGSLPKNYLDEHTAARLSTQYGSPWTFGHPSD